MAAGRGEARGGLPLYAALRSTPSRGLPPALATREADESFAPRTEALERQLLEPPRRPGDDGPLFTLLLDAGGLGLVTLDPPGDGGPCLPAFSTPPRAADYAQTHFTAGPRQPPVLKPRGIRPPAGDVGGVGVTAFALDRCPRCSTFSAVSAGPVMTAGDALRLCAVFKSTEPARADIYMEFALDAARAGRLEVAREVALETVGHVTLEDPRPHLLLGQLGVGLVREARAYLGFLGLEARGRKLDGVARPGSPDFDGLV